MEETVELLAWYSSDAKVLLLPALCKHQAPVPASPAASASFSSNQTDCMVYPLQNSIGNRPHAVQPTCQPRDCSARHLAAVGPSAACGGLAANMSGVSSWMATRSCRP
jgi:hypothetical protein